MLEGVQRVIQLGGSADWTAAQLGVLRARALDLPSEDAHTALMATASLLASMCALATSLLSFLITQAVLLQGMMSCKLHGIMHVAAHCDMRSCGWQAFAAHRRGRAYQHAALAQHHRQAAQRPWKVMAGGVVWPEYEGSCFIRGRWCRAALS